MVSSIKERRHKQRPTQRYAHAHKRNEQGLYNHGLIPRGWYAKHEDNLVAGVLLVNTNRIMCVDTGNWCC